jgi:hypothetical protein
MEAMGAIDAYGDSVAERFGRSQVLDSKIL